jgi:hypothetical protein
MSLDSTNLPNFSFTIRIPCTCYIRFSDINTIDLEEMSGSSAAVSTYEGKRNENGIPPFSALPLSKEDPYLSAWGLYGEDDQLGTLNRLDNEKGM